MITKLTLLAVIVTSLRLFASDEVPDTTPPSATPRLRVTSHPDADNPGLKLFELLDARNGNRGNIVFSPYSAITAMQMAQLGAAGNTLAEIDAALGALTTVREPPKYLYYVNYGFYDKSATLQTNYSQQLKEKFNASFHAVDFTINPELVRQQINSLIAQQTRNHIRDIFQPGSVKPTDRLILVNALYCSKSWKHPFPENRTHYRTFTSASGTVCKLKTMHLNENFSYIETNNVQIIELAGLGKEYYYMTVYLPREMDLAPALALLHQNLRQQMQPTDVALAIPKFRITKTFNLLSIFKELGIHDAFTPNAADFSPIFDDKTFGISYVLQGAMLAITELGVEAAAATGMGPFGGARDTDEPQPISFIADHPFVFTLSAPDDTLLFVGIAREP